MKSFVVLCVVMMILGLTMGHEYKKDDPKVKECAAKNKITDMTILDKFMKAGYTTTNHDDKVSHLHIEISGEIFFKNLSPVTVLWNVCWTSYGLFGSRW